MEKHFIHTFQNGNRCHLIMGLHGEDLTADAAWDRTPEGEWPEIEGEYLVWRDQCFDLFSDGLSTEQKRLMFIQALKHVTGA